MIGEKIKQLRKEHHLTLERLANALNKRYPDTVNFNKGKISKWENNKEEPRLSSVRVLADFFQVPLDFFNEVEITSPPILTIYKQLQKPRQEKVLDFAKEQLKEQELSPFATDKDTDNGAYITAYIEGLVAAGRGIFQDDNLHMEVRLLEKDTPKHYDTIAKVVGDSMTPLIEDNDLLFIKASNQVEINDIGIFQVNGKNFVKKLKRDYNGAWYLQSLNNSYEEIYLSENDDIRTIGEVVKIYKEGSYFGRKNK